jgi:hypothetical protein
MMNQTQTTIDTQGNTFLIIEFSSILKMLYNLGPNSFCRFRLAIVVDGVGNKTIFLQTVNHGAATIAIDENIPFYLNYKTNVLPSGTYNVSVYWYSDLSLGGNNYLAANYFPTYNNSRSLMITEYLA